MPDLLPWALFAVQWGVGRRSKRSSNLPATYEDIRAKAYRDALRSVAVGVVMGVFSALFDCPAVVETGGRPRRCILRKGHDGPHKV